MTENSALVEIPIMAESLKRTTTIAEEAFRCMQKFKALSLQLQTLNSPQSDDNQLKIELSITPEMIKDTWGRFNVWTGNIGALQRDQSSLDYRLRHADVREEVLRLLKHMHSSLSQLWDIASGVRKEEAWDSTDAVFSHCMDGFSDEEFSDSGDDDTENLSGSGLGLTRMGLAEDMPKRITESHELYLAVGEALSGLFQLSMFIHKSTRRNKFGKFSADKTEPDTQIDIRHVYDRFPFAAYNHELIERLGKANARRRQWLLYKRRHREKLASATQPKMKSPVDAESKSASQLPEIYMHEGSLQPQRIRPDDTISIAPSEGLRSQKSALSSTVASTFQALPQQNYGADDQLSQSDYSEATDSESINTQGDPESTITLVPQPPPESADGNPFECPYCFQIVAITGRTSWTKHVHSDLSSYVCTMENCSHPLFESRQLWFNHELDVHRHEWTCDLCPTTVISAKAFQEHMKQAHSISRPAPAGRPVQQIPASACPLCDYDSLLRQRRAARNIECDPTEPIMLKLKNFRGHLGRHLEQLALFVLPRSELMELPEDLADSMNTGDGNIVTKRVGSGGHDSDIEDEDDSPSRKQSLAELDHAEVSHRVEAEGANQKLAIDDNASDDGFDDSDLVALLTSEQTEALIATAPELAMGWLPPMNFTPPDKDFEQDDVDMIPRREDCMYGGDLFTPGWVRGYGKNKEGFCGRCEPGRWLNMEDGSYRANLVYKHGISDCGKPLPRPSSLRQVSNGFNSEWEGFCEDCQVWRAIRATERGWNWFRHCETEHLREKSPQALDKYSLRTVQKEFNPIKELLDSFRNDLHDESGRQWSPLHYLAEVGDKELMEYVLGLIIHEYQMEPTADAAKLYFINARSVIGETPLMVAALQGNEAVVKVLLDAGADVNATTNEWQTALDFAAEGGYPRICEELIRQGADVKKSKVFCRIQRQKAVEIAKKRSPEANQVQENKTISPSRTDKFTSTGQTLTPLMLAAKEGDAQIVEALLHGEADIDLEATTANGETSFMLAAANSHIDVLNTLRNSGANIDAINTKGWTALMIAVKQNSREVVDMLISYGADVNHVSPDRWTALAEATCHGYLPIMQSLLRCKADTESRSMHDWTPLMHAAFRGDESGVKLLLEASADMDVISQHDESALLLAAAGKHSHICLTLLELGCAPEPSWATPNVVGHERTVALGWTPLMLACQNGLAKVVKRLLEAGVCLEPRSPYDKTALEIAKENGHETVLELLKEYDECPSHRQC